MLRAAIIFFLMGIMVFLFGVYGIAEVSLEAAKLFLLAFFMLASLSLVAALSTRDRFV